MKKTILAALLVAACSTVIAADWVKIAGNQELVVYGSKDYFWREGSIISMWQLLDLSSPLNTGEKSVKTYVLMNCKNMTISSWHFLTTYDGHMGYGNVIGSVNESPQWKPVTPDTTDDFIMRTLCKK